jgi:hypothetical protein
VVAKPDRRLLPRPGWASDPALWAIRGAAMGGDQPAEKDQAVDPARPAPWWRRRWKAVLALVTAAVTSAVTALLVATINFGFSTTKNLIVRSSEPAPFQWIVQPYDIDCPDASYVIDRPPKSVPAPPEFTTPRRWAVERRRGAAKLGGVERQTHLKVSLQGRSATAVILQELRVIIVDPSPLLKGNVYALGDDCGGQLGTRSFFIDLDEAQLIAGDSEGPFPYKISESDPEVFVLIVEATRCNCTWYIELDWVSAGRVGTVRIDDRGRPFYTGSGSGPPYFFISKDSGSSKNGWVGP